MKIVHVHYSMSIKVIPTVRRACVVWLLCVCFCVSGSLAQNRKTVSTTGAVNESVKFVVGIPLSGRSANINTNFWGGLRDFTPPVVVLADIPECISGVAATISAEVIDDHSGVDQVILRYRVGGESLFSATELVAGEDGVFRGEVPEDAINPRGVEFYINAIDNQGNESNPIAPAILESVPVLVDAGVSLRLTGGSDSSSYQLVSFPLDLDEKSAAVVLDELEDYNLKTWRLLDLKTDYATFDGIDQYNEFEDSPISFVPGRAYWMVAAQENIINSGAGKTNVINKTFNMSLHPGWNMIGVPFNFNIPLDNVVFSDGEARPFYRYEDGWKEESVFLRPYGGYIVDAGDENNLNVSFSPEQPPSGKADSAVAVSLPKFDWDIQILAQAENASSEPAHIQISNLAVQSKDDLDKPSFLSVRDQTSVYAHGREEGNRDFRILGDGISVYFPHPNWNSVHRNYRVDARPKPDFGDTWDIDVDVFGSQVVALNFDGLEDVPEDMDIQLVDMVRGAVKNLRVLDRYVYGSNAEAEPRRFKLLIGQPEYIDEQVEALDLKPDDFMIEQNYPNPFSSTTTIRYGLAESARVTIEIYNILGQQVGRLAKNAIQDAGYHTITWDALGSTSLASGLYVYRITAHPLNNADAEARSLTRQMVFVK